MIEQNSAEAPGIKSTFSEWLCVAVVFSVCAGLLFRARHESATASMFAGRDPLAASSLPLPPYALLPSVSHRTLEVGPRAARDAERETPSADAKFHEMVGRAPLETSSLPVPPTSPLPTVSARSDEGVRRPRWTQNDTGRYQILRSTR